eukprot:GCRY01004367.1.p1 GENE.GCRY01004367.1~~GCRY01004367.1.p1  ORF type:complete len:605 (+),score=194.10 GCRY01004367.1:190-2004(+)
MDIGDKPPPDGKTTPEPSHPPPSQPHSTGKKKGKSSTGLSKKGTKSTASFATLAKLKASKPKSRAKVNHAPDTTVSKAEIIVVEDEKPPSPKQQELQTELEELKAKFHVVESERNKFFIQTRDMEKEHQEETLAYEAQIKDLRIAKHQMHLKVELMDSLQNAVLALFLEVSQLSSSDSSLKDEFTHLKRKNPLVILDYLRGEVRTLLAFKDDFEKELEAIHSKRETESNTRLQQLESELKSHIEKNEEIQARENTMAVELAQLRMEKDTIYESSTDVIDKLKSDNLRLLHIVKAKDEKIDELNSNTERLSMQLRQKDIRLMKVSQLESVIEELQSHHKFEIQKLESQHLKEMRRMEKEFVRFSRREVEFRDLEKKLAAARLEIKSFKTNLRNVNNDSMREVLDRTLVKLEEKEAECAELDKELRRTRSAATRAQDHVAELKASYDKLFTAVSRQQEEARTGEPSPAKLHELATANPYHVDIYKAKLKEKEKEIIQLNARIRRLISSEHRVKLKTKQLEQDFVTRPWTSHGTHGDAGFQSTLLPAGHPHTAFTEQDKDHLIQTLQRRNQELEEKMKDYENLQTMVKVTQDAYEALRDEVATDNFG